jgi:hypothetical protein
MGGGSEGEGSARGDDIHDRTHGHARDLRTHDDVDEKLPARASVSSRNGKRRPPAEGKPLRKPWYKAEARDAGRWKASL